MYYKLGSGGGNPAYTIGLGGFSPFLSYFFLGGFGFYYLFLSLGGSGNLSPITNFYFFFLSNLSSWYEGGFSYII